MSDVEIKDLEEQIKALEEERDRLEMQISELDAENERLEEKIDDLRDDDAKQDALTDWAERRHDAEHTGSIAACRDEVCDALTLARAGRVVR